MFATLPHFLAGATLILALTATAGARPDDPAKKKAEPKKADAKKADPKKADKKKGKSPATVPLESTDMSKLAEPAERSEPGKRSKEQLEKVLAQYKVESNPRYQPRKGATFCNIFTRDVCYAMGVKLPHMLANNLYGWLGSDEGKKAGWKEVNAADAQKAANAGRPTVVSFRNPGTNPKTGKPRHGHIAPLRPGEEKGGPWLCNVGAHNYESAPLSKVFGKGKKLRFFINQ